MLAEQITQKVLVLSLKKSSLISVRLLSPILTWLTLTAHLPQLCCQGNVTLSRRVGGRSAELEGWMEIGERLVWVGNEKLPMFS